MCHSVAASPASSFELAGGGDVRRFTAEVQQACRQLPQPPTERVAVLVDQHDVVVVVQREDGDRAVVLDHFAAGDVAVWHADLVGAECENVSDIEGFA